MNSIISHDEKSLVTLDKIEQLEGHFLDMPQVDCPVVHHFAPGIYIREVTIPADTFSIGHYQKCEHLNVMLTGRVTMIGEDGRPHEVTAPAIFTSKPGRKIGYIHETMRWLNIYPTAETDVEKLEETYLHKSQTWEEHQAASESLLLVSMHVDQSDYQEALKDLGVTEELVRAQSENEADQIPFPLGSYKCKVSPSRIEGKGLFATGNLEAGEVIAPARIDGKRTPAGRYTNHGKVPNARMVMSDRGDIYLVALRPIAGCAGGNDGEEITIDYRQAVEETLKSLERK